MARSKRNANAKGSVKPALASSSTNGAEASAADLLAKAESILTDSGDAALAVKFAERAAANISSLSQEDQLKLKEMLGLCALELGEDEKAKAYFQSCSKTSSISLLYLAQLADSPEEALAAFRGAVEILSSKLDLSTPADPNGKQKLWSAQEKENRVQITRALVGMTELYLTDLCFEPDAEAKCTEYLDLALRVDGGSDINPEIYSTLASVRLSQQRNEDALKALQKSYSIWQGAILADPDEEHPATPLIPPFANRMNIARLFIECESYEEALEILGSCEEENDEDLEMLYLLGLVNWLIADSLSDAEEKRETYIDSREVLERFVKMAKKHPKDCDPEMGQQVEELMGKLEKERSVTAKDVAARQEAQNGDGTGDLDDTWEDVEDNDEEMS